MTDIDPRTTRSDEPQLSEEDAATREAAGQEPRSFGGEDQGDGPEVSYGDPSADDIEQRADARPDNETAEIAADDVGASAMAERAGRDIEQEGR